MFKLFQVAIQLFPLPLTSPYRQSTTAFKLAQEVLAWFNDILGISLSNHVLLHHFSIDGIQWGLVNVDATSGFSALKAIGNHFDRFAVYIF